MGKASIAADFIRLFKNNSCRYRNQAGTKMGDGHLISNRVEFVVRGLFHFPITETREVLLDYLSIFESFFEFFAVSGHTRSGIVSDINVFCAAITFSGVEGWMFGWAGMVILSSQFFAHLQGASKFDTFSVAFCPSAS